MGRTVFQAAAVYAVTAWLLIQIIISVETPLNLPAWSDTLVIVLVAIGFPIALILSCQRSVLRERAHKDGMAVGYDACWPPKYLLGARVDLMRWPLHAKIDNATITAAYVNYVGSITIDRALMEAVNLCEGERVRVASNTNGERLETYVIP